MAPEANWYPDPERPGLRWWDGSTWTEHRKDAPAPPAAEASASAATPSEVDATQELTGAGSVDGGSSPGTVHSPGVSDCQPATGPHIFEERAVGSEGRPDATPMIDPQETYRQMAADPGAWVPSAPATGSKMKAPSKDHSGALTVLFVVAIIGACLLVFGHHGGSSGGSGGSGAAGVESNQEKCERFQKALDKTAEILHERGEVPAYDRPPSQVAEEHGYGC